MDYVTTHAHSPQGESQLYIFEDNEAVIRMIIKSRSPTMRHVSRTHRVALHWLFDRINLDPKIHIKHVDTQNQLADMLTKGTFTRDELDHLLRLLNIMNFSMFSCSHFLYNREQSVMSKRAQESTAKEGSAVAKPRPMNLVSKNLRSMKKDPPQGSSAANSPGKQKLDQSCVSSSGRKLTRNVNQNQQFILKRGSNMTLYLLAPGNWGGVVNLQAQSVRGNWTEVMTFKSEGQGWNSTICRSPTIDTSRKSSRTCGKSRISQKKHQ